MGRWQRYWFAEGGRLAIAVVRIAVAWAVLVALPRITDAVATASVTGAHALYRPVGIWMVLGHLAPPPEVVFGLELVAWTATVAMALGLASRATTAVSLVASLALASLSFSASRSWSHQYNVIFLAQLALLGARCGDALSLDALIRRWRGRPAIDVARGYQWSARLVQLAVALMFAGAAFHKLLHGHLTLRWALSDNLRHHLLVRYDLAGLARPPLVDWLIDDVWRYRTAALLNLISQATPIAACFLMRRPGWRAAAGGFFVIETIALGFVVDLWNWWWLPLYAVFVDWDALIAWIGRRRRPEAAKSSPADVAPAPAPRRAVSAFIAVFVAYDLVTAFVPGLDQRLNTYPFSAFPMFATIRARAPYDEHLPYTVEGDHFEVIADEPVELYVQRWFDHVNRGLATLRDPEQIRARLEAVRDQAHRRWPDFHVRVLRIYLAIFEAPAYPAAAHFELHPIAILGELRDDDTFRTAIGTLRDGRAEPHPRGVDLTGARMVYYRDDVPTEIPLDGPPAGDPVDVVAIAADGTPWLVASHADWHWQ